MNIFQVDSDPVKSAQWLVDRHVVKMSLESIQLLSTAHRLLDGTQYIGQSKSGRKAKRWLLPDDREKVLYGATHTNHPSTVWCRANTSNYNWLYEHTCALLNEYTYRYGKVHKCAALMVWLRNPPINMPLGNLTPVTPAMPDEYKVPGNSVESYRNYYRVAKERMHSWKNRETPPWI
jgi:hypothetical protein